jgi:hypothetical protein
MIVETLFTLSKDDIDLDVEEWSSKLGLIPMECCRYGKKIPVKNSNNVSSSSYWTIGIKKTEVDEINDQVLELLNIIYLKKKEINSLIDNYGLESGIASFVWVDDDFDTSDLNIYLESETIKKIGDLQGDFSVCVY